LALKGETEKGKQWWNMGTNGTEERTRIV